MKLRIISIILLITTTIAFSSCATILAKKTETVSIASEPHGADVYVNGFKMGTTPIELNLKPDKTYMIEFKKDGFDTVTRIVNSDVVAGWIILDVFCGVLPILVDAVTGDWKSLDQELLNASLVPKGN